MRAQKNQPDKPFEFPHKLLEQINECSAGGFMLFTFDDHGNPQTYLKFDSVMHNLAMQQHLSNWVGAMQEIQLNNTTNIISGNLSGNDDD